MQLGDEFLVSGFYIIVGCVDSHAEDRSRLFDAHFTARRGPRSRARRDVAQRLDGAVAPEFDCGDASGGDEDHQGEREKLCSEEHGRDREKADNPEPDDVIALPALARAHKHPRRSGESEEYGDLTEHQATLDEWIASPCTKRRRRETAGGARPAKLGRLSRSSSARGGSGCYPSIFAFAVDFRPWKVQRCDQRSDLEPRCHVAHRRQAQRRVGPAEIKEGEAHREQLAVNHPVAEAAREAEAYSGRKLLKSFSHRALVVRACCRKPVAHDDPVDIARDPRHRPALARVPHHFRIETGTKKLARFRVEPREKIEIDKTVIQGGDDRVGVRMRKAGQMRVGARAVDHDEMAVGQRLQGRREMLRFGAARFFAAVDRGWFDPRLRREMKAGVFRLSERPTIFHIPRKTALTHVEVDRRNTVSAFEERYRNMHRGGRFARSALFIAENDDVRHEFTPERLETARLLGGPGLTNQPEGDFTPARNPRREGPKHSRAKIRLPDSQSLAILADSGAGCEGRAMSVLRSIFWFCAGLAQIGAASAEIIVSPLRQVITRQEPVAIYEIANVSDRIIDGRVSWTDLAATDTGYVPASADLRARISAAPFLVVSPARFRLEPGKRTSVAVKLRKGASVPPGERRSHLLIETKPVRTPLRRAGGGLEVDVGLGVSTPVILRAGLAVPAVAIEKTRLVRDSEGLLELQTSLTRTGKYSSFGKLTATLVSQGKERLLSEFENVAVHVDASQRTLTLPLGDNALPPGMLTLRYVGKAEFEGRVFAEKSFEIAPPQ